MKSINVARFGPSVFAAAAVLAGCGGSQPPTGTPGVMPQSRAITAHSERGASWMLPEVKKQNLLYIADPAAGGVIVYTYEPPRYKFVGLLADAPAPLGECVDKAQHIFVNNSGGPNGSTVTFVYEHGRVDPIRILGDPGGVPISCSVDPATGNLAVSSSTSSATEPNELAVYAHAKGRPALIAAPDFSYIAFCAYDERGDLFADGLNARRHHFILEELPAESGTFVSIKVSKAISPAGGIQWDGQYLVVGDPYSDALYRFKIKGHIAKEIDSIPLNGATTVDQFFITGNRIIDPSGSVGERSGWVDFYPYPAGGDPGRNLPNFSTPYAVVISRAQNEGPEHEGLGF